MLDARPHRSREHRLARIPPEGGCLLGALFRDARRRRLHRGPQAAAPCLAGLARGERLIRIWIS